MPGRSRCAHCIDRAARLRQKRREEGLCYGCGGKAPTLGKKCHTCRYWSHAARSERMERGACAACDNLAKDRKALCDSCAASQAESRRLYINKCRATVLAFYGASCKCCGETTELFLTIDHINNDGYKSRIRKDGVRATDSGTIQVIRIARAIATGKPRADIQILCFNCNCGRARNHGVCPHREVRQVVVNG